MRANQCVLGREPSNDEEGAVQNCCDVPRLALAACATPNKQYQAAGSVEIAPSRRYPDNVPYGKLAAIEFDEQGDIWTSAQLNAARRMIRESARRPLLIAFVHGWHNNARANNENLQSFNQLLKEIADRTNSQDREVQGIYIGWRGLAIERAWDKSGIGWLARYLSFYSRKSDTDLVAGIPLTRALYVLASDTHAKGGRVIFIGHSFGGRILGNGACPGAYWSNFRVSQDQSDFTRRPYAFDQSGIGGNYRPQAQARVRRLV